MTTPNLFFNNNMECLKVANQRKQKTPFFMPLSFKCKDNMIKGHLFK